MMRFARETAPCLLAEDVRDALPKLEAELLDATCYFPEMQEYLFRDPNYVAFAHPNLNIDNAWFWADGTGALDCGVLDWGGFCARLVAMHIRLSLFAGEHPLLEQHEDRLLSCFVAECRGAGGPQYDIAELATQLRLVTALSLGPTAGTVPTILRLTKPDEWRRVRDRHDERVEGRFLVRCYTLGIRDFLTLWKRQGIGHEMRWAQASGLPSRRFAAS